MGLMKDAQKLVWVLLILLSPCRIWNVSAFSTTTISTPRALHVNNHRYQIPRGFISPSPSSLGTFSSVSNASKRRNRVLKVSTDTEDDAYFDLRTTFALVGGQSLLVVAAIAAAAIFGTPNFGLGPGISLTWPDVLNGTLLTIPLGALAASLDLIEDRFPALKDVSKATQRSVLSLLGSKFKPVMGLIVALMLGAAAGIGEEMLFRGILQFELSSRFGSILGVSVASIIFGALHAVTPLYALLAGIASIYFGTLYIYSGNLVVPIVCHAVYDVGALLFAHWTVSQLSNEERDDLASISGSS